jgi:hypothetical protein
MTDNIVVLQALVRDLDKLLRDSWKERDALKAEITAMKQQEPAGGVVHNGESAALYDIREQGALLYTLPGAEHAPSEEARLVSYCPDGNTCTLNINGMITPAHIAQAVADGTITSAYIMQPAPSVPEGFSREDLEAVAAGLDGYEKTVNVGNVTGEGDDHLESTTAYAARFIRAMLAAAPEAKP